MEGTNIGLQKWAFAIYMMVTSPKGIASTKDPKGIGVDAENSMVSEPASTRRFRK